MELTNRFPKNSTTFTPRDVNNFKVVANETFIIIYI